MTTTITAVQSTRIKHGVLVRFNLDGTIYRLANTYNPITYNGEVYTPLGNFMGMNEIQDELRATNNKLSISISGIPSGVDGEPNYVSLMLTTKIKGSRVQVYRVFFDPDSNQILSNQVYLRFSGYISNYTLTEGSDPESLQGTNTITVDCSNIHGILENQVIGRRTNATDFDADTGMYRVSIISGTNFDFGKPFTPPSTGTETDTSSSPGQTSGY